MSKAAESMQPPPCCPAAMPMHELTLAPQTWCTLRLSLHSQQQQLAGCPLSQLKCSQDNGHVQKEWLSYSTLDAGFRKHLESGLCVISRIRQLPTSDGQVKRQPAPQDIQTLSAALLAVSDHQTGSAAFLPLTSLRCVGWPVPHKNLRLHLQTTLFQPFGGKCRSFAQAKRMGWSRKHHC